MAFDMTPKAPGEGFSGPRLIPTNVPLKPTMYNAVFCTYVELGEHDQSTPKYPDKGTAPMAQIEFEFPQSEHVFDEKKGAQPLREGRCLPLYANEKANAYKYFCAISKALSDKHCRDLGKNPIPANGAGAVPTYASLCVTTFEQMLSASLLINVTNSKPGTTRKFVNYLPAGTTLEQVKAAKEANSPIQPIPEQNIPWVYSNVRPEGIQSTLHPSYGATIVDLHPNSVGIVKFLWDDPTPEDWKKLYPWMRDKIKKALNYTGSAVEAMVLTLEQAEQNGAANEKPKPAPEEEDLGPAFPSEASGMDDVPF